MGGRWTGGRRPAGFSSLPRAATLAAGTLIFLLLGIIYSWSVFVAPLEKAFGWKRDATSLVYVVSICCFVIGSILSGPLIQRFATRTVIVISAAMLSSGFFMSSRVHSVWHLYLSYGVLCGLGIGVAYTAVLFAVMGRYGDKPGLASGVLLMGFGLGGFILGPAVTAVIYGPVGWRATYVLLGFVFGAVLTAGSFFVSLPPAPGAAAPGPSSSTADFSPGRVIRSRSYRWYLSWVVLVATNGMAVLSMGAPLALDIGASPMGAAVAAGVLSMGNGMGRLLFGHLFDRHGRPAAMLTASVFFAAAAVGVLTAYSRSSYLLLLAAFLATGISYGSTPILNSCFSRSVYGEKFLKYNLGIINLGYLVSAPLGAYGAGIVKTRTGGYLPLFLALMVFSAASLGVLRKLNRVLPGA